MAGPDRVREALENQLQSPAALSGGGFRLFGSKRDREIIGVPLNENERCAVWKMATKNPVFSAMMDRILDVIVPSTFVIMWGDEKMVPNRAFQEIIDKKWIPFIKNVIMCVIVQGVVPVTLVKLKGTDIWVPKVPNPASYLIYQQYDHRFDGHRYRFYRVHRESDADYGVRRGGESGTVLREDKKVVVLSDFGYDPDMEGNLTSPVSKLIMERHFQSLVRRYEEQVHFRRANQIYYTEPPSDSQVTVPPGAGTEFEYYGDMTTEQRIAENTLRRNEVSRMIAQENRRVAEDFYIQEKVCPDDNVSELPYTVPLPRGHKLHAPPVVTGRTDLHVLAEMEQALVGAVLGVPRSFVFVDHRQSSSSGDRNKGTSGSSSKNMLKETLNKTIRKWLQVGSRVANAMYDALYGPYDRTALKDILDFKMLDKELKKQPALFTNQLGSDNDSSSDGSADARHDHRVVRVELIHAPALDLDDILYLCEEDMIEEDTAKVLTADTLMLPLNMFKQKKECQSKKQRKRTTTTTTSPAAKKQDRGSSRRNATRQESTQ